MTSPWQNSSTSTIQGSKAPRVVMLLALAGPPTSASCKPDPFHLRLDTSTSTLPLKEILHTTTAFPEVSAKESILEIKRLSGLTWEELGKVFGVTRRSVHNWARGEAVTASHDAMIQAVLEKVRRLDQGSAMSTASRLRSLNGEAPLYSLLASMPLSALEHVSSEVTGPRNNVVVDQATLMANWRPVAPFRDRWDDEPVGEVVPVGTYPVKRLKVATKRRG